MRRRRLGGYPACRGDEEEVERLPVGVGVAGGHCAEYQTDCWLWQRCRIISCRQC
jgi:hypothetical protein